MNSFMVYRENQEYGPYTLEMVKNFAASGNLSEADYIRSQDSVEWSTVGVVLAKSDPVQISLPPPIPTGTPTTPMRVALPAPRVPEVPCWYYGANGKRIGPVTNISVNTLIAEGMLNNKSLVWREGFADWVPIEQTTLKQTQKTPPPLMGSAINNGFVWTVAFVPLIGRVIEYIIASAINADPDSLWFVTLGLTVTLCVVDDRILKRAGHDEKKFGLWAWLVPVYLFKRAKALGQSLAYFITWMICFFVSVLL